MTASVRRPEDVINIALTRIGYPTRIENIREGTKAARAALLVYGDARDALLRDGDWGFAQLALPGVASGGVPLGQWSQSYLYPVDCLKVRDLYPADYTTNQNNPLPILWEIASSSVGRVILTNEPNAVIVYTQQIINPANWEPLFVEALGVELAKRLAPVLSTPEAEKFTFEDEKTAIPMAQGTVG